MRCSICTSGLRPAGAGSTPSCREHPELRQLFSAKHTGTQWQARAHPKHSFSSSAPEVLPRGDLGLATSVCVAGVSATETGANGVEPKDAAPQLVRWPQAILILLHPGQLNFRSLCCCSFILQPPSVAVYSHLNPSSPRAGHSTHSPNVF